jgi:hypothetical protein
MREEIMNFTPKKRVGPVVGGILAIAVVGLIGSGSHTQPGPIVAAQNTPALEQPIQASGYMPIISAVEVGSQTAGPAYYQPITEYHHKGWWKRNAPIVGGAGGGALIGGLAGGGKGALIGGAVGGGGGYLYKRHREHHHHHQYYNGHR